MPLAICELPDVAAVQCAQHPDPRVHQEVPAFRGTDQAVNGDLPFGLVLFGLWQLRDVVGSILQGDEGSSPRKRNRIFKRTGPAQ